MIDFLHLRAEVEAAIAEQAARHAGPLNELRYALDVESGLVADRVAFTSAGLTFHALLSERSGSLALRLGFGLLDGVLQLVARARTEALEEAGVRVATAHQEHEALVGLIAAGRPTQARELWARHCAPRRSPDDRTPLDIFALLEQPPGARTRW